MLKEVLFLSAEQMNRVRPTTSAVVISILDRSEARYRPLLSGYRAVLTLDFEDTSEETKLARPNQWPEEPTDAEHARFAQGKDEHIPTLTDARKMVAFINEQNRSDEPLTLYVHCRMGVSRSAAVAQFVSDSLSIPLANANMRSTAHANPRVGRLLAKAAKLAMHE